MRDKDRTRDPFYEVLAIRIRVSLPVHHLQLGTLSLSGTTRKMARFRGIAAL